VLKQEACVQKAVRFYAQKHASVGMAKLLVFSTHQTTTILGLG
jgi:hypothetical protein